MEEVNYYYSDELTNDDEGNLVQLCRDCAHQNQDVIQWAQQGDSESECELCDKVNDPIGKAEMNAYLAERS